MRVGRNSLLASGALGFALGAGVVALVSGKSNVNPDVAPLKVGNDATSRGNALRDEVAQPNATEVPRSILAGERSGTNSDTPAGPKKSPDASIRRAARVERSLHAIMSNCDEDYSVIFKSLGLNDDESGEFKARIAEVIRAKIEAVEALNSFNKLRIQYDNAAINRFGDQYGDYLAFERGTLARRQLDLIDSFASSEKTVAIDPREAGRVSDLVEQFSAYTPETADEYWGPYGDPALPIGGPNAMQRLEERHDRMVQQSGQLLAAAKDSGVSQEATALLARYYQAQIERSSEFLAVAKNPDVFYLVQLEARLRDLKNNPNADPLLVQKTEAIAEALRKKMNPR